MLGSVVHRGAPKRPLSPENVMTRPQNLKIGVPNGFSFPVSARPKKIKRPKKLKSEAEGPAMKQATKNLGKK